MNFDDSEAVYTTIVLIMILHSSKLFGSSNCSTTSTVLSELIIIDWNIVGLLNAQDSQ